MRAQGGTEARLQPGDGPHVPVNAPRVARPPVHTSTPVHTRTVAPQCRPPFDPSPPPCTCPHPFTHPCTPSTPRWPRAVLSPQDGPGLEILHPRLAPGSHTRPSIPVHTFSTPSTYWPPPPGARFRFTDGRWYEGTVQSYVPPVAPAPSSSSSSLAPSAAAAVVVAFRAPTLAHQLAPASVPASLVRPPRHGGPPGGPAAGSGGGRGGGGGEGAGAAPHAAAQAAALAAAGAAAAAAALHAGLVVLAQPAGGALWESAEVRRSPFVWPFPTTHPVEAGVAPSRCPSGSHLLGKTGHNCVHQCPRKMAQASPDA
jgi:hypothetical protein